MAAFAKYDGIDGESKDATTTSGSTFCRLTGGRTSPEAAQRAKPAPRRCGGRRPALTIGVREGRPKLQEKCLKGEVIPKLETRADGDLRRVARDLSEVSRSRTFR